MRALVLLFVVDSWMVAEMTAEGYTLPLSPGLLGLMPLVFGALAILRAKVPFVEEHSGILLPILSVVLSVGLCLLTGQSDPVLAGIGVGAATSYSYDLGKGAVQAVKGEAGD